MASSPPAIRSVTDALKEPDGRVRIAGRVRAAEPRRVLLADAFDSCWLTFESFVEVSPGDLLTVDVTVRTETGSRSMYALRLVSHVPVQRVSEGEFHRFAERGIAQRLRDRAAAAGYIRSFFQGHDFLEVETPFRVRAPGTDVYLEPLRTELGFLITSPEFHMKRLLSGGLPRIFQLARCTRLDESGPQHEPEFTMLEWYRAFADVQQTMQDTEALIRGVVQQQVERGARGFGSLPSPFHELTVREAFQRLAGVSDAVALAEQDEERYFQLWVDRVEPGLRKHFTAVFITHFPACHGALARPTPGDPTTVERFELILGGIEICNGYGELCDGAELRRRFDGDVSRRRREGKPELPIDERLLAAMLEGLPPCSGNAVGFDRLLAACWHLPISDFIAFPAELPTGGPPR